MRLIVAKQAAGRDIGDHQRARTVADKHATGGQQPAEKINSGRGRRSRRIADTDHPAGETVGVAGAKRLPVKGGAGTLTRGEHLVGIGVVDNADHGFIAHNVGDGHAPDRNARNETGGAVDRIDDPQPLTIAPLIAYAAFLSEKPVLGEARRQAVADHRLYRDVRLACHVLSALLRDLQVVEPPEKGEGVAAANFMRDVHTILDLDAKVNHSFQRAIS